MAQLFDELDAAGTVVRSGVKLTPRDLLPDGHKWVPHEAAPLSESELQERFTALIEKRLVDFAATRRYDNPTSAAKYKDLTDEDIATLPEPARTIVQRYVAETRRLLLLNAWTWAAAEVILGEVLAGTRATPDISNGLADVEADLPALTWASDETTT